MLISMQPMLAHTAYHKPVEGGAPVRLDGERSDIRLGCRVTEVTQSLFRVEGALAMSRLVHITS
jgi:hypothetical protein